jgi:hypothetical protein|nr:MAG TPA: hypothetical protein [Caudoviricetes sp.]
MARKGAGIVVEIKRPFINDSSLANMSYYRTGELFNQYARFDVCNFNSIDLVEDMLSRFIKYKDFYVVSSKTNEPNTAQLNKDDIAWIIDVLFESLMPEAGYVVTNETFRVTKRQITTLTYVESLMNQGLVEVEWYDWR